MFRLISSLGGDFKAEFWEEATELKKINQLKSQKFNQHAFSKKTAANKFKKENIKNFPKSTKKSGKSDKNMWKNNNWKFWENEEKKKKNI